MFNWMVVEVQKTDAVIQTPSALKDFWSCTMLQGGGDKGFLKIDTKVWP